VDLGEASGNVGLDQGVGVVHRLLGLEMVPGVWSEVVASEDYAVAREAVSIGDLVHEVAEVGRSHAGVPAELVHLVGRRLHKHGGSVVERLQHRGFENQGVR